MNPMKQILTILILSLVSCDNRNGVEFIVHNESQGTIDSVRISTGDKKSTIKLFDIQKGLTKEDFLDMRDILKIDGHYILEITASGQTRTNDFGYYTNGFSLDKGIDIYFMADTIIYKYRDN